MVMSERLEQFSYMHQERAVSVTVLLVHLSQVHQGPTVGATELSTRVHRISAVGARELRTGVSQMH